VKQFILFILIALFFVACGEMEQGKSEPRNNSNATSDSSQSSSDESDAVVESANVETMKEIEWKKSYDWAFNGLTTMDRDDNFYSAYTRSSNGLNITLIKTNSSGTMLWKREVTLDLEGYAFRYFNDGKISFDEDGYLYITGSVYKKRPNDGGNLNVPNSEKAFILKVSSLGKKIWQYIHGSKYGAFGTSLTFDSKGNIYFSGREKIILSQSNMFVITLNQKGTNQNYKHYSPYGYIKSMNDIIYSQNALYLLTSETKSSIKIGRVISSVKVIKTSLDGKEIWSKVYDKREGVTTSNEKFVQDDEGNFIIGGTKRDYNDKSIGRNIYILKISTEGEILWEKSYGTDSVESITTLIVDKKNNIFVGGSTGGAFDGYSSDKYEDAFISKLSFQGDVLKTEQFSARDKSYGKFLGFDKGNHLFFGGFGELEAKKGYSFLIKYK